MTSDLLSQGYFFQQLQWSITTFIGELDITDYIVILRLFCFVFCSLTLYLLFHDLLFYRHMQDNQLTGTLNVLQDLPLKDLYVPIPLICCQLTGSLILAHNNQQIRQNTRNYFAGFLLFVLMQNDCFIVIFFRSIV